MRRGLRAPGLTTPQPANIPEIHRKRFPDAVFALVQCVNLRRTASKRTRIAASKPYLLVLAFSILLTRPASVRAAQASPDVANSIAEALRSKDYDQALRLAQSSLHTFPNDTKVLTLEGLALSGLGKPNEALGAYNRALKITPDYLPALEGAAQIEYNAGSNDVAVLLKRILKIRRGDPTSHAMLGVIAYQHRDCDEAVQHFRASGQLIFSQRTALEQYGFLVGNGDQSGIVSYGVDINAFAGDLIQNESLVPTRLNPSFGQIIYTDNDRHGNYESVFFDFRGRFSSGFFDASYTRSESKDDAGHYPISTEYPSQYYGPSPWDVPNRFSLTLNYQLPGLNRGEGCVGHVTGGWGLSGTSIFQSGYPFTVINQHPFVPICANTSAGAPACPSASNPIVSLSTTSGDYNADGDDYDYPNVTNYQQGTSKHAFLTGVFASGQFGQPTMGTEGNEKQNLFREPNFAETDAAFYKDNRIGERVNIQIRFEFFNIFNRANFGFVDADPIDPNFGKVTSQQLPRWWQVAARVTF
jgi:tetratricopeptide (TPR) repeat protein